jgi:hypothetical protein
MSGLRLDGAGQAKLKTLDEAMSTLLRINGLVTALPKVKRNQSGSTFLSEHSAPTAASQRNAQGSIRHDL